MNPTNEHYEKSMTIQELLVLLKRYLVLIIAAGIIGGVFVYCVCSIFVAPVYEANAKMIVTSRQEQTGSVTSDQITSAKKLMDTYAIIIRGRYVLEPVIDKLQLSMSVEKLAGMVSVTSVNNTQVMQISVQSQNPAQALQILENIVTTCPAIIVEIVDAGSVKTIEPAKLMDGPVAPKKNLYTVVATLLSMVAAILAVVIQFLLDNTYKSEAMLRNDLGIPVLGVIPEYEYCHKKRKESKEGKYYDKA